MERWRPVAGFPHYEVSDHGRVRSLPRPVVRRHRTAGVVVQPRQGRVLRPSFTDDGYPQVVLCNNGHRLTRRVHLLVLTAFRGSRPGTFQGLHNDGDSRNCRLGNLRWGSPASNTADAMAHGTHYNPKGAKHGCAKLTEHQAIAIKRAPRGYGRVAALATKYGVTTNTIWQIQTGRSWRHLGATDANPEA